MVQVHHDEGVANRIDPESCADAREGIGEALTGERIGQPLSRESTLILGADVVPVTEGNTDGRDNASAQTARRGLRNMARHLFFAITLIGIGVLLNSPAEAVPDAARCEDQAANCLGRCQPLRWDGSEQMPELLRPAGDQMFDTRAWRGRAVVGGDGIEPPTSTELTEHDPSR